MTHKIYHSLIAALIGAATTGAVQAAPIPAMGLRFVAAEASDSSISVRSARVLPHERSMIVSMCIRVDRDLKGTESIELRPVLTDSTGHSAVLPPFSSTDAPSTSPSNATGATPSATW